MASLEKLMEKRDKYLDAIEELDDRILDQAIPVIRGLMEERKQIHEADIKDLANELPAPEDVVYDALGKLVDDGVLYTAFDQCASDFYVLSGYPLHGTEKVV